MQKNIKFHVVIAAAGRGERFGEGLPKQYRLLGGKPVLRHSLEKFSRHPGLASLTVVIDPAHKDYFLEATDGLKPVNDAPGKDTRKGSVYSGLQSINAKDGDIILIHDAARPLVSFDEISALLEAMNENDAASLALPVTDTLRRESRIIDRSGLWALQTPQAFRYDVLKKAHETTNGDFTDDTGLVSALGVQIKLVQGSRQNIKITHAEDFIIAEKLLSGTTETRTGMGYDVHAFSKDKNRKLMLCGIEIPGAIGLEGHSDADAPLHALTDAILGTIGAGDIGLHFPPSDMAFKNRDSRHFLETACRMVAEKGGVILNADITLICEQPKISPYRDAMQEKIAEILGIEKSRVNVKATTNEGLGFIGRGEGIAAQAIASVRL